MCYVLKQVTPDLCEYKMSKYSLDHSLNGAFQGQWKQMMKHMIMEMNITWLKIPTSRRQTGWIFTNVAEELN